MEVGEVKVLMYGNPQFIDVGTAVVHCSGAGYANVMVGGACFGLCAEEEREVMALLEVMERRI